MIIEVDEYKKKIPGYNPEKSELVHSESAKLANKDFDIALKSQKYKRIIFMAGGTASGKTEFAFSYLNKKDQLVYDGTLKTFDGFQVKLKNIQRYTKNNPKIKVVLILPEDITKSFAAFLKRDRKMENVTFFNTHILSKISISKILINSNIRVEIYISRVLSGSNKLDFIRLPIGKIGRKKLANSLILIAEILHRKADDLGLDLEINFDMM